MAGVHGINDTLYKYVSVIISVVGFGVAYL